jgi:hypothetical protein
VLPDVLDWYVAAAANIGHKPRRSVYGGQEIAV